MENKELENFSRADVINTLQIELESIPDDDMPNFFIDTIIRYLSKLYDINKLEVIVDPYTMGEFDVVGYDDNGYEIRRAKMTKLDDDEDLPDDGDLYWLTSFKLYYNDSNLMPRVGNLFDAYKLRTFLIHLLLEQPTLVFPNVENPEIDIMLNMIMDIHEWSDIETEELDDFEDDDSDFDTDE